MDYLIHLAILIGIYALLGMSLNLLVGYTGLVSLAQASFFGVGAYATAILTTRYDWGVIPTLAVGVVCAVGLSLITGWVLSALTKDWYTLASLAFNSILFTLYINWNSLTQGATGIAGIPRPSVFVSWLSSTEQFLIGIAACVIGVVCLCVLLTRSSFGCVLTSIREDESAIQLFGFRTPCHKRVVCALAAAIAGLAGGLMASYVRFIDPSFFSLNESLFLLTLVILGGLASHAGAFLGAAVLILLPEALRFVGFSSDVAAQLRQLLYGISLVLLIFYRPQGLVGRYSINSS